ncbi:chorismate mutase (plasmid) [Bacillus sp. 31A1R]|uniref:chorismate mutase n=1 Tax=Robertmurraya mangrovi TaxID=3098077 RepID=A0ABU5IVM4_9BACI|nr:chorismate mutase [Bacillus sp. 31A1R]MDZ5471207.1 chorismate mutase [Bacillus sp. 31A1R]
MIRGVRGATTVTEDLEGQIVEATGTLLEEMIKLNEINPNDVASIFISVTEDLTATFPAKALRSFDGWTYVPVMCMKEIPVPSALRKCIRIMIHLNTSKEQNEIQHVYLEGASSLRPDLK